MSSKWLATALLVRVDIRWLIRRRLAPGYRPCTIRCFLIHLRSRTSGICSC